MIRLPAILAATLLVFGCATQPPPTGPGTATFTIAGSYTECHSFGGCEYSARIEGPGVATETTFDFAPAEHVLAIGAGMPHELADGTYTVTFTSKLMSDLIANGQRDSFLDATCGTEFVVGPGQSSVAVRVVFSPQRCGVDLVNERT